MVVRDRSVAEITGRWQRKNPSTPSVSSKKPGFNSSTSVDEEANIMRDRPVQVRRKSYSTYADKSVIEAKSRSLASREAERAEKTARAAVAVDWQRRSGSLLDHSRSLRGQTKALSHLSNMETMRQQQQQRHDDRHGQERAREVDAERAALKRVIEEELSLQEAGARKDMEHQINLLSQSLADTERRAELNQECITLRQNRCDNGNALLDESQRLLQKQKRELQSTRFQLTELLENLTSAQGKISPLHEMLTLLAGDDAGGLDATRKKLQQAQYLVNEVRLRHNQIRHHVSRAADLIRRRTTGEEKVRLALVDALEQQVLESEDLLAALHDASENAKADLEEAHAIVLHQNMAAQREELIMQLTLASAAIDEDQGKKEDSLEQDQRCHWYQTCDEMLPYDEQAADSQQLEQTQFNDHDEDQYDDQSLEASQDYSYE